MQVDYSHCAAACALLHRPPSMSSVPPPAPIDVEQQLQGRHHLRMLRLRRLDRFLTIEILAQGDFAKQLSRQVLRSGNKPTTTVLEELKH